jgi:uncharacterized Tic20 family protein
MEVTPRIVRARQPAGNAAGFRIGTRRHRTTFRGMDMPIPTSSTPASLPTKEERLWAVLAHVSAFAMYFTVIGHLIGPLVIWLAKRDGHPFVGDQGKEALNFQITWTIMMAANVLLLITIIGAFIAVPLFYVLPIYHVVCMIIAAIKANEGVPFRYPLTLRFIK